MTYHFCVRIATLRPPCPSEAELQHKALKSGQGCAAVAPFGGLSQVKRRGRVGKPTIQKRTSVGGTSLSLSLQSAALEPGGR